MLFGLGFDFAFRKSLSRNGFTATCVSRQLRSCPGGELLKYNSLCLLQHPFYVYNVFYVAYRIRNYVSLRGCSVGYGL